MAYWDRVKELRKQGIGWWDSLIMARAIDKLYPGMDVEVFEAPDPRSNELLNKFNASFDKRRLEKNLSKLGCGPTEFNKPSKFWILIASSLAGAEEAGSLDLFYQVHSEEQSLFLLHMHRTEIRDLVIKLGQMRDPSYTISPEAEALLSSHLETPPSVS